MRNYTEVVEKLVRTLDSQNAMLYKRWRTKTLKRRCISVLGRDDERAKSHWHYG